MTDQPTPTRSVMLRISSADPLGPFDALLTKVSTLHRHAARHDDVDTSLYVTTDQPGEEEHLERDALLALADRWRDETTGVDGYSSGREAAADELVRLIATLDL